MIFRAYRNYTIDTSQSCNIGYMYKREELNQNQFTSKHNIFFSCLACHLLNYCSIFIVTIFHRINFMDRSYEYLKIMPRMKDELIIEWENPSYVARLDVKCKKKNDATNIAPDSFLIFFNLSVFEIVCLFLVLF